MQRGGPTRVRYRRVGESEVVEPRLDVITLAVADLDRALALYRELGLESSGIGATEWTR